MRTPSTMKSVWSELAPRRKIELWPPVAPELATKTPGVCASAVRRSTVCSVCRSASGTKVMLLEDSFGSWGVRVAETT